MRQMLGLLRRNDQPGLSSTLGFARLVLDCPPYSLGVSLTDAAREYLRLARLRRLASWTSALSILGVFLADELGLTTKSDPVVYSALAIVLLVSVLYALLRLDHDEEENENLLDGWRHRAIDLAQVLGQDPVGIMRLEIDVLRERADRRMAWLGVRVTEHVDLTDPHAVRSHAKGWIEFVNAYDTVRASGLTRKNMNEFIPA